jgi:hypothetical protein
VVYEGADAEDLQANFHAAGEEYLLFYTAEGKTPDSPVRAA